MGALAFGSKPGKKVGVSRFGDWIFAFEFVKFGTCTWGWHFRIPTLVSESGFEVRIEVKSTGAELASRRGLRLSFRLYTRNV